MRRRAFLTTALTLTSGPSLLAALRQKRWDDATEVLERATAAEQVDAAVLHVVHEEDVYTRPFGKGTSGDSMFYLARSPSRST